MADQCKKLLMSSFEDLSPDDINKIVDEARRIADEAKTRTVSEGAPKTVERVKELRAEGRYYVASRMKKAMDDADKFFRNAQIIMGPKVKNAKEGLLSLIEGSEFNENSIENKMNSFKGRLLEPMVSMIKEFDLDPYTRSGELDREIVRVISTGVKNTGKYADQVNRLADIARRSLAVELQLKNSVGGSVANRAGYFMKQFHNGASISGVTFEEWASFVIPKLDLNKSFSNRIKGNTLDMTMVMKDLLEDYNRFAKNSADMKFGDLSQEFAKSNLDTVDRMNKARSYHFKDSDSFMDYNERFGTGKTYFASLNDQLHRTARAAALVDTFGSKPRKSLEQLISYTLATGDNTSSDAVVRNTVLTAYDRIADGGYGIPRSKMAKVNAAIRTWDALALLGKATISTMLDVVPSTFMLSASTGRPFVVTAGQSIGRFMKALKPSERRQAAKEAMLYLDGLTRELQTGILGDTPYEKGKLSKALDFMFTVSGFNMINDAANSAALRSGFDSFTNAIEKASGGGKMGVEVQNLLNRMQLTPAEISAYKQIMDGGALTVSRVLDAKIEGVDSQALATKLQNYLVSYAGRAVPRPDAKTRRQMELGTDVDTFGGQIVRYMGQFKATAWKATTDLGYMARMTSDSTTLSAKSYWNLVQAGAFFTSIGMLKDYLSEATREGEAMDFEEYVASITTDKLVRGMVLGGAMGLYGDIVLPAITADTFAQGQFAAGRGLLPPVYTQKLGLAIGLREKIMGNTLTQRERDQMLNNIPFQNLWFAEKLLSDMFNTLAEEI